MKVLLVSEGKHEESGALEAFARRTSTQIKECSWANVRSDEIHTHRGKGQGFFKRALRWVREAEKRGYDALVLVIDEDGYLERIKELEQAQNETTFQLPRALGIAIRSFDAWMLADERALTSVLSTPVQAQSAPELNRDPKATCAELLDASDLAYSTAEFYARVANVVNLDLLERRCPKGFGVFATRLRSL